MSRASLALVLRVLLFGGSTFATPIDFAPIGRIDIPTVGIIDVPGVGVVHVPKPRYNTDLRCPDYFNHGNRNNRYPHDN